MNDVLRIARLKIALQRAFLGRAILIFTTIIPVTIKISPLASWIVKEKNRKHFCKHDHVLSNVSAKCHKGMLYSSSHHNDIMSFVWLKSHKYSVHSFMNIQTASSSDDTIELKIHRIPPMGLIHAQPLWKIIRISLRDTTKTGLNNFIVRVLALCLMWHFIFIF